MFEKIVYKLSYFDLELYKIGDRENFEIYPDGNIVKKKYPAGSKKISEKQTFVSSEAEVERLYEELRTCIDNANDLVFYTDDTGAELNICYPFERVEKMQGGLTRGDTSVSDIMNAFLARYSDEG